MPVLTGIDILGIQDYIFTSNRLRDVLAASWMVEHATEKKSLSQWGLSSDKVLLAAGGNAIVEFTSREVAKEWSAHYTRWLFDTAPGLEVGIAHRPYEPGLLAKALLALQIDLARAKLERRPNAPQLGLSVTASCSVTGLPATAVGEADELISRSIQCLRRRIEAARARWDEFLPTLSNAPSLKAEFPDELDQMGRTHGDTSLIGVVHVDANNVGEKINTWLKGCIEKAFDDNTVRNQYREWSDGIRKLGEAVLRSAINRTAQFNGSCFLQGNPDVLGFQLRKPNSETVNLPLRPILLGGDDITFVCDGRIALDLAATALREFPKHEIHHLGKDGKATILTACAGVALVKAHAPFHRSYELAERLCESAKKKRREANSKCKGDSGCWLDWHIGATRPGESIEDIRQRQYQSASGTLTMRPYPLVKYAGRDYSWDWLDLELLGPGNSVPAQGFRGNKEWTGSRNRVKHLGALVAHGNVEVQRQFKAWQAIEPSLKMPGKLPGNKLPDNGFFDQETPLLDVIELLDLHLRLESDLPQTTNTSLSAANRAKKGSQ